MTIIGNIFWNQFEETLGDFKVGVSVGVYCTKCTLNTGVNTNFEITHYMTGPEVLDPDFEGNIGL
jgi:hypothetical protein